ncbi:MAG: hypothetical protein WCY27_00210 [archaeon]|jgi:hypothetical protein|nr:hypothetical protein [archaeon]MDD2477892.1 hypothetical protein [Candidatus ainarchaeum sp.]MDD3084414.1 hypothetical protein [Candidatus ainarchaeum sp.]MDD4220876.1 hypothetical protein [Candidatus ainarchaeum sp.]MDD4662677.1 hypothetical protein [Candidatus ainarchaeum sp.]
MIKSLEVVIAITILFLFVIIVFQSVEKPQTNYNELTNKNYSLLLAKAKNSDFRDLVSGSEIEDVYNSLYESLDTTYSIKICNSQNLNCEEFGETVPSDSKLSVVDYYFFDSNKTLSVISWID